MNTVLSVIAVFALLAGAALLSVGHAQPQSPLCKDPAAPMEKRVDDLVSRMTLEEKVSQLMSDAAPVDRLGIPGYNWWNECLHGVNHALPLSKSLKTIAVIGPNADELDSFLGDYNGEPSAPITPLEGIRRKLPS